MVMAAVCQMPHATRQHARFFPTCTLVGAARSSLSPCPSCPADPRPHVYTSPVGARAREEDEREGGKGSETERTCTATRRRGEGGASAKVERLGEKKEKRARAAQRLRR